MLYTQGTFDQGEITNWHDNDYSMCGVIFKNRRMTLCVINTEYFKIQKRIAQSPFLGYKKRNKRKQTNQSNKQTKNK